MKDTNWIINHSGFLKNNPFPIIYFIKKISVIKTLKNSNFSIWSLQDNHSDQEVTVL